MSDEPQKRSWAWIGWVLVAAFLFYPLSIGPVRWIVDRTESVAAHDAYRVIYKPLAALSRRSPTVHQVVARYLRVWVPRLPPP